MFTTAYHVTSNWTSSLVQGGSVMLKASQPLMAGAEKGVYFAPTPLLHYAGGERNCKYWLEDIYSYISIFVLEGDFPIQMNSQEEEEIFFPQDLELEITRIEIVHKEIGRAWWKHNREIRYFYCAMK